MSQVNPPPLDTYHFVPLSPLGTEISGGLSNGGTLVKNEGTRFGELLFSDDTDLYEKFYGAADQGSVALGNPDVEVNRTSPVGGEYQSGTVIAQAITSISGGHVTYTFRIEARDIPEGTAEVPFRSCNDRFEFRDTSSTDPLDPNHLLHDSNVVDVTQLVEVTNVS